MDRRAAGGEGALDDYRDNEAGIPLLYRNRYDLFFKETNLLAENMQFYESALWTVAGMRLFEGGVRVGVF